LVVFQLCQKRGRRQNLTEICLRITLHIMQNIPRVSALLEWNDLKCIWVTRLSTIRSERITARKTAFCRALQLGYTEHLAKGEAKGGRNLLSRTTCYSYINAAGREVNETSVPTTRRENCCSGFSRRADWQTRVSSWMIARR